MSLVRKMLAVGFAAGLALLSPIASASAHAQPLAAPLTAPITAPQADPAEALVQHVVAQLKDETVGKSVSSSPGVTADAIFLLAQAGTYTETADLAAWLESRADTITEPVLAAKVAVALHEVNPDSAVIDQLIATALAGMKEDGSVGWPSAFTQSWPIIALAITGNDVPQEMIDNLFTHQGSSGLFGYRSGGSWTDDADGTAMALFALLALRANPGSADADAIDAQLDRVITAAQSAQHDDGYWTSYSPANSTGLLGMALHLAGEDISDAVAWMVGQQLDDGGLPGVLNGTSANLLATLQGGLILNVTAGAEPEPTPTPQPTPAPQPTPEPTTEPTPSEEPAAPASPTPTPSEQATDTSGKPAGLPNTGAAR